MSSTETVALLFTDVVGSTELLTRVGEERAEELRREQLGLVGAVVEEAAGRVVKNLGDGVMAAFGVPTAALDAAVGIQQRIEVRNRRADERLLLRVGVSLGEADVEDGDYFGTPVVEAARLCDLADGGQILSTGVVPALAGSRGGHRSTPLGTRELKGLDAPVEVCEIAWAPLRDAELVGVPLPARLRRPESGVFVGRSAEVSRLLDAFKDVDVSARRRIVLVSGEPGIGKTSLLVESAAAMHEQGAIVCYGRCDEDLAIPYQPWRETFEHLASHVPDAIGERERELSVLLGATPDDSQREQESLRYALYRAAVDSLVAAATDAPVVVMLEDLHWADAPTIALLRQVAELADPSRILVVGTFRDADVDAEHPLSHTLAALHRETGIDRLALRGLDDLEVLDLLETLAGHEMDDQGMALRDALRAETDGNPFFATEILRHLSETGAIAQQEDGRWVATTDLRAHGLPVSVREVVGRRVAALGPATERALAHGSVFGREFELDLLAATLGRDPAATYALLEPAISRALLVDVAPGRFSFTHALVEHALYDSLSPTARAFAHRAAAEALERHAGDQPGARSAELAHHWAHATTVQDIDRAATHARHAGDYALAQLAPDEAVRWYQRALELVEPIDEQERCEILVRLGEAQRQAGDPGYRETLLDACRRALTLDQPDLLVRATLANNRGSMSSFSEIDHERVEMLRAAIPHRPTGPEGALLRALLVAELRGDDPEGTQRAADEAVELARSSEDDWTFARVARVVEAPLRRPMTLAQRTTLLDEAHAAAERAGDPALRALVSIGCQGTALEHGDLAGHDRWLARVVELAARTPEPYPRWCVMYLGSVRSLVGGEIDRAEVLAEEALEFGLQTGQPDAFSFYAGQLSQIRRAQGRLDEIIDAVAQAAEESPDLPVFRAGLAACLCDLDRADKARAVLRQDLADDFRAFHLNGSWSTAMLLLAEVTSRLAEPAPAQVLVDQLAPWRDQVAYTGITCHGSLARGLGLALATVGRFDEAVDAFEQALRVNAGLEAPILVADTELDLARTVLRHDASRAREVASSARTTAERLGLRTIQRRATALLAELDAA